MSHAYHVVWTETARKDLVTIIEHISLDSLERAQQLYLKLVTLAESLSQCPERGRVIPELRCQGISSYRELIFPPWRLMYRVEDRRVVVLAVLDGRRNPEDILLDRF